MLQDTQQTILTGTVQERAILYARTSGDDTERDSLSDQLAQCQHYATGKRYNVVASLQEDVTGVSGADWNAPKLLEALEKAKAGLFDVLIVRDVKRFSRDIEKAVHFDGNFQRYGVRIEYVWNQELNGKIDATTKLLKLIRYWEGESDRIDTVKRLYNGRKKALRQKKSVIVSARPPYGYRVEEKEKGINTLAIVENEAAWIKRIFEWFTQDMLTLYRITTKLKELEVPTPTESDHRLSIRKTAGRCEWHATSVRYILTNETYIGRWSYGKNTKRNNRKRAQSLIPDDLLDAPVYIDVPRIIDNATFEIARRRLIDLKAIKHHKTKHEYLLQGRCSCGRCGYSSNVDSRVSNKKRFYYYRCNSASKSHKELRCGMPTFPAQKVDDAIWQWVKGLLLEEGEIEKSYCQHLQQAQEQNGLINDQLLQAKADIAEYTAELKSQLTALKELSPLAKRARAAINQDIERLETLLDRQEARLSQLQGELKSPDDIEAQFQTLRKYKAELIEGAELAEDEDNFDTRKKIIEALNVTFTMHYENGQKKAKARAEFSEPIETTIEIVKIGSPNCQNQQPSAPFAPR